MAFIKKIKVGGVSYDVGLSDGVVGTGLGLSSSGVVGINIESEGGLCIDGNGRLAISGLDNIGLGVEIPGTNTKVWIGVATGEHKGLKICTGQA